MITTILQTLIGIILYAISISSAKPTHAKSEPDPIRPTRFRVLGVDRETRMDVIDFIEAASPENAKAKGELQGIVVTRVDKE